MAVRGPQEGDVRPDAVQPDELVHPFTLDRRLALQFQAQFDEERDGSREIIDHHADVIHALDRHALDGSSAARARAAWRTRWSRSATFVARRAAWA